MTRNTGWIALCAALAAAVGAGAGKPAPASPTPVEVEMRNVDLHVTEHITLQVRNLRGRFVAVRPDGIPNLDDNESYVVDVDAGEIAVDEVSLNALMNEHVFAGHKPPVKGLKITMEEGQLKQKGKLDKAIDLPFRVKGGVEATPDGKIRVHAKSIKSLGLPVGPLMKVLGIEMDDLLKVEAGHGVTVDENDFIIDPQQALPPPRLRGKVAAVRIEGNQMIQTFGSAPAGRLSPPAVSTNHIYWRGGHLRFGKLTMRSTDLELIDQDPSDPFDFSVSRYNDMLVAGYSKNLPRLGLRTYMPDHNDLGTGKRVAQAPPR
jgi:hypothetical protein